jgi:hypothetical protein
LHTRVRPLWANGGVSADEWNCSAREQGPGARESLIAMRLVSDAVVIRGTPVATEFQTT